MKLNMKFNLLAITMAISIAVCTPLNADSNTTSKKSSMPETSMAIEKALQQGKTAATTPVQLNGQNYPALAGLGPVPVPPDNPMTPEKVELGKATRSRCS